MSAALAESKYTEQDLDRFAEELNRDGITVIRGLLDTNLVEEWVEAFDALFRERQDRPGGLAPREQARYYLTLPWTQPFANREIFANPTVLGVLNRVFAQEYVMVQMGADVPVEGSDYQETHRDFRSLFTDDFNTPLYAVAVNFPLVDVNEENGPFQMARGTHNMPRAEGLKKVESGEIPLESFYAQKGDVTIRSPLALHRGSPNRSAKPRPMIVMGYVMHWLHTPKVDLTLPRAFYESLPEEEQKILRCEVVEQLADRATETYVDFKY